MFRVIKLGGSLLSRESWADDFLAWYKPLPKVHDVLVVGGGQAVNSIRTLDHRLALGEISCHVLAVALMDVQARIVAHRIQWPLAADSAEPRRAMRSVVVCGEWMDTASLRLDGPGLPVSWAVSSDSIAAWVARTLRANELLLLKSLAAPTTDPTTWHDFEYVDECFLSMIGGISQVSATLLPTKQSF
jgi:aspartokinase-like uncharacterized kinase